MGAHDHGPVEVSAKVRRSVQVAVSLLGVLTIAALVVLWPGDTESNSQVGPLVAGEVVENKPCADPSPDCARLTIRVVEGEDEGLEIQTDTLVAANSVPLSVGTGVWLTEAAPGEYGYSDIRRDGGLIWLGVVFAAAVIAFARWKGVAALAGLASSLVLLVWFVLPALLEGTDPVLVAAAGAAGIAFVSMGFAHGISVRTGVALIGTVIALLITLALGTIFSGVTSLTGLGSEDAFFLELQGFEIDLRGLFLAGLVIGALGVLDDVTVTQAAAVNEVKTADPSAGWRTLFTSGMRVGRDHVAATVNTLVLAYVGAALPLFLLLSLAEAPLLQSLNSEILAQEVVRGLVGSMGIIAAVPITTALMALVLTEGNPPTTDDKAEPQPESPADAKYGGFWQD